jgi:hypothetical protein
MTIPDIEQRPSNKSGANGFYIHVPDSDEALIRLIHAHYAAQAADGCQGAKHAARLIARYAPKSLDLPAVA